MKGMKKLKKPKNPKIPARRDLDLTVTAVLGIALSVILAVLLLSDPANGRQIGACETTAWESATERLAPVREALFGALLDRSPRARNMVPSDPLYAPSHPLVPHGLRDLRIDRSCRGGPSGSGCARASGIGAERTEADRGGEVVGVDDGGTQDQPPEADAPHPRSLQRGAGTDPRCRVKLS